MIDLKDFTTALVGDEVAVVDGDALGALKYYWASAWVDPSRRQIRTIRCFRITVLRSDKRLVEVKCCLFRWIGIFLGASDSAAL